jgi:hypothetical protein
MERMVEVNGVLKSKPVFHILPILAEKAAYGVG